MLATLNNEATMTSREIANLVELRHDNVKRTIDSLVLAASINRPQIEDGNKSANGVVEKVYVIGKRDTYVIVAQLSPAFTARLVDRWQELEAAQKTALPISYKDALIALVAEVEAKEQAEAKLLLAAPKVEFVDKYVEASSGSMGFREVCKILKVKEPDFRDFLKNNHVMYQLNGNWCPYYEHLDAGRFEVKTGIADNEHAFKSAKFTPKGFQWISQLWNKGNK